MHARVKWFSMYVLIKAWLMPAMQYALIKKTWTTCVLNTFTHVTLFQLLLLWCWCSHQTWTPSQLHSCTRPWPTGDPGVVPPWSDDWGQSSKWGEREEWTVHYHIYSILSKYSGYKLLALFIRQHCKPLQSYVCKLMNHSQYARMQHFTIWRLRFSAGSRMMELGGSLKTSLKENNIRQHFNQIL